MFYYLACPYSHTTPAVMKWRRDCADMVTAHFMSSGIHIFSPLSHCHEVATYMPDDPYYRSWDFWREYDFAFLEKADKLIILTLPGWESSIGVQAEIQYAQTHNISIEYVSLESVLSVAHSV